MSDVLLLHQYFPPDDAVTGRQGQAIASALAQDGHRVSAIVGQPSYQAAKIKAPRRETYADIDVLRVSTGPFRGRAGRLMRFGGYLVYLIGSVLSAMRRRPDVIVTFHIPPFLPGLAILLAMRRGARVVYVPQDIHPDILIESGWLSLPRPIHWAWDRFNRWVLERSDCVIALGEGMRQTLIAKGAAAERTHVVPVWAAPALEVRPRDDEWRAEHGIAEDELLVLYAGNMGLMHPVDGLLDAAAELRDRPIRFVLAGEGVRRAHWEQQVRERGLENVAMLPYQRGDAFPRLVAAADLAVVALRPGMERLAVPSRPYPFLAAGRPVLAITDPAADIAQDVVRAGAGWHVDDGPEITGLLRRLESDRAAVAEAGGGARALYEERFTPEAALTRYRALVSDLVA